MFSHVIYSNPRLQILCYNTWSYFPWLRTGHSVSYPLLNCNMQYIYVNTCIENSLPDCFVFLKLINMYHLEDIVLFISSTNISRGVGESFVLFNSFFI